MLAKEYTPKCNLDFDFSKIWRVR